MFRLSPPDDQQEFKMSSLAVAFVDNCDFQEVDSTGECPSNARSLTRLTIQPVAIEANCPAQSDPP